MLVSIAINTKNNVTQKKYARKSINCDNQTKTLKEAPKIVTRLETKKSREGKGNGLQVSNQETKTEGPNRKLSLRDDGVRYSGTCFSQSDQRLCGFIQIGRGRIFDGRNGYGLECNFEDIRVVHIIRNCIFYLKRKTTN